MRLIKMFGMAAIAVVAAMAFVGVTSAMAENTSLCESDTAELACATGIEATHVHNTTFLKVVHHKGEPNEEVLARVPAKLLSSVVNVECDVLYLGDALGLGAPLVIHGNFSYSNCNTESGGGCTVTEVSKSALLSVLKTGSEVAEVTGTGEVLVECSGFIHCTYNGTGLKGEALGSLKNGHVTITKQTVNKVNGFLCPKTATLDILTESLTALYIRN